MKSNSGIASLLFLLLGFSLNSQTPADNLFTKGVEAYSSENYSEALEHWTALYKTGNSSAELLYNIGNANFKLNKNAAAILFYERALLYAPGDEDIKYNLQIAQSLTVDRFNEIPGFFLSGLFDSASLIMRSDSWALISIICFVILLLLLTIYLFSGSYRLKVTCFWIAASMLLFTISSLALSLHNKRLTSDSRRAVIFASQISGKSSPDESGTDLFILHEGTIVNTGNQVGEWNEVRLTDGNKGWIPASAFEII